MEYKDYYAALSVKKDATQDDIKRDVKKLARKYHPDLDKQAGAEEEFKEFGDAHEVLGGPYWSNFRKILKNSVFSPLFPGSSQSL